MAVATYILLSLLGAGLLLWVVGIASTLRHRRIRVPPLAEASAPPVTFLKPIKGDEESLADNLRTFFEQDYPDGRFELVFATTEEEDPGIDVARRVAADYPHVPVRFVRSDPGFGLNPKVANLAGALRAASHDLVFQSDANVRIRPDYLRRVVAEREATGASLLTSMVVGVEERSVGAAMENLQLSAFIGPAMCTALHVAGIQCVVGKSMLFSRRELTDLGGLEQVRDILAEDFILGQTYQRAGKTVVLSATTVENVNQEISVSQFLGRHSRWLKMRAVIHVGGFFADLLANPVALGTAAFLTSGLSPWVGQILLGVIAFKLMSDALLMRLTRGHAMAARHLIVAPLKDALMGAVWVYSVFSRSVCWRGVRLRLGSRSRLRPDNGALPVRLVRRVMAGLRG